MIFYLYFGFRVVIPLIFDLNCSYLFSIFSIDVLPFFILSKLYVGPLKSMKLIGLKSGDESS